MLAVGMVVTWTGYAFASWGYVLVRGWDICLRQWLSPLHPYQWHGTPGMIPSGQVFPSCPSAGGLSAGPMQTGGTSSRHGPKNDLQTPDVNV